MFCTECGKPIKNGYKFCPYCGNRMDLDLMDDPQQEAFPSNPQIQEAEEAPADPETEVDFFADSAEADDSAADEPETAPPPAEQENPFARFSEDGGMLDPPPTFTFEEEPKPYPQESLQNAPYFIYHPKEDMHRMQAEPGNQLVEGEYRPGRLKNRPAAVLVPIIRRGPSIGIKVLIILFIIAAALAVSIVGYQYLFAAEPFAKGWFFGI